MKACGGEKQPIENGYRRAAINVMAAKYQLALQRISNRRGVMAIMKYSISAAAWRKPAIVSSANQRNEISSAASAWHRRKWRQAAENGAAAGNQRK